MTKRMLIDATHAEETRVVVLDGNRLEDFDVETAAKKQLKGNIYLAKVVRVEPSLQAAFVEYGGGRHGFLAFGEIHPDYYQIPVADRQRLMELQEAEARAEEEADDAAAAADEAAERAAQGLHDAAPAPDPAPMPAPMPAPVPEAASPSELAPLGVHSETSIPGHAEPENEPAALDVAAANAEIAEGGPVDPAATDALPAAADEPASVAVADMAPLGLHSETAIPGHAEPEHALSEPVDPPYGAQTEIEAAIAAETAPAADAAEPDAPSDTPRAQPAEMAQDVIQGEPGAYAEELGADFAPEAMEPATADIEILPPETDAERAENAAQDESHGEEPRDDDNRESRAPARFMRHYKIQEVIRRRQILLIQVVKEERGSKGAALTTYISLAGRFSVLMPNSPRGGGISRKITSTADRRRLKEIISELQIPRGMGLIVRTAGANRPKGEIRRDCEYLLELWDSIRETTMQSIAPALIHEEASLIKRAIRDNYSRDVDEVLVDGEAGWRAARDFMRMLMPAHARKVVLWNNPQPLFAHQAVEAHLDAMLVPTVQLRSGGYLVINQTEALVAVDVNSGRSTRERGIEETALKTNLEAADEVARQLRLRDLAGLIVIDFIDMESRRNNGAVEKRLKDALKDDRARIQVGSISAFGLMEMSRQRLRPSLAETSFTPCPHCGGTGHVRSTETSALAVLRQIEEEGAKRRAAEICVHVAGPIALYVLNHKRQRLAEIEARYGMSVMFAADDSLLPPQTRIEKLRAQVPSEMPPEPVTIPIREASAAEVEDELVVEEDDETDEDAPVAEETAPTSESASEGDTRRRRRRRRGGRREDQAGEPTLPLEAAEGADAAPSVDPAEADQPELPPLPGPATTPEADAAASEEEARSRRRGRRGGRRRRRDETDGEAALPLGEPAEPSDAEVPAPYVAPARPAYTGPTPADPFGGGVFDIYDVMERAEAQAAAPFMASVAPVVAQVETQAAPTPERHEEPVAAAPVEALPEPVADAAPVVDTVPEADPVPVVESVSAAEMERPAETTVPAPVELEPAQAALPMAEPVTATAAPEMPAEPERAEPVAGPVSAPVIIGADTAAAADKKRGWWRR